MIEQGIQALLSANPAITAIVGNNIFPVLLPEGITGPTLTYSAVSGTTDYHQDGSEELTMRRVQFDARSPVYGDCKNVLAALKTLLSGFSGPLPDGTQLLGCFRSVTVDSYEPDPRLYCSMVEYTFHFAE